MKSNYKRNRTDKTKKIRSIYREFEIMKSNYRRNRTDKTKKIRSIYGRFQNYGR